MQNSFFFDSYNYGEDLNEETDTGSVGQLFIHSAMVELCINTIRFFLSVRDGCGRGRNKFAGRVQNNHVRFSFTVS